MYKYRQHLFTTIKLLISSSNYGAQEKWYRAQKKMARKKMHSKKGHKKTSTSKKNRNKKISLCKIILIFSSFFLLRKNYLMLSLVMSVRLSVRPSSVEISLERGCTITNRPIDLKFGLSIGGGVMHV